VKNYIRKNRRQLKELFDAVSVSDGKGRAFPLDDALMKLVNLIFKRVKKGGKLLFIGNGGSASIASHLATDFLKNARISAMAFNDASLTTCLSNDFGYEYVFEKPIEILAASGDILFAISSSGRSENILLGVKAAKAKGATVVTLSGFDENNPLRRSGEINFYVPSGSYGNVEIMHLLLCHSVVDVVVENKRKLTETTKPHE